MVNSTINKENNASSSSEELEGKLLFKTDIGENLRVKGYPKMVNFNIINCKIFHSKLKYFKNN